MAFSFNNVTIPFQSNVTAAINGIKQLGQTVTQLGQTIQVANKFYTSFFNNTQANQLRGPGGDPFRAIDNSALRVIDRMARFLTAISGVKNALDLAFGSATHVSQAFEAAGEGVRVFSNLAQLAKDNLGLVAAGVTGLAAAAIFFTTAVIEASIKATDASTEATIKSQNTINDYTRSLKSATEAGQIFQDTFGEKASRELAINRAALEAVSKQLQTIGDQKEKLEAQLKTQEAGQSALANLGGTVAGAISPFLTPIVKDSINKVQLDQIQKLKEQVGSASLTMDDLKKRFDDIKSNAAFLVKADELGKFSTKARDLNLQLNQIVANAPNLIKVAEALAPGAEFGVRPVEQQRIANAQAEFKIRNEILTNLFQQREATQELLTMETQLNDLHPTDERKKEIEELTTALKSFDTSIGVAFSGVLNAQKKVAEAIAPGKFTEAFTIPLTNAISDAVINGIVNGKKGAEILADLTKNLMTAALNDVAKRFQQGLIDVFKAVAGAGGELLGSALITVVGVVAGVLGRKKSSSDSFASIQSRIDSSEAVRGIVSGPANVAIAAVGDNLKRALVGVEQRLDALISITSQIRDQGSGPGFAGSVSTP